MLEDYLNETISVDRVTGVNEYNEPTTTSLTIKARVENKVRLVRNAQGVEVVSNTTIFTLDSLNLGDFVMNRPIISIMSMKGLEVEIIGYEVLL